MLLSTLHNVRHSSYCSLKKDLEHAHHKSLALGWFILYSYSYAKRIKIVSHHPSEFWTFWQNFKFGSFHDDMTTVYLAHKWWNVLLTTYILYCIFLPNWSVEKEKMRLLWYAACLKLNYFLTGNTVWHHFWNELSYCKNEYLSFLCWMVSYI